MYAVQISMKRTFSEYRCRIARLCDADKIHVSNVGICQAIVTDAAGQALLQNAVLGVQCIMLCIAHSAITHGIRTLFSQAF